MSRHRLFVWLGNAHLVLLNRLDNGLLNFLGYRTDRLVPSLKSQNFPDLLSARRAVHIHGKVTEVPDLSTNDTSCVARCDKHKPRRRKIEKLLTIAIF